MTASAIEMAIDAVTILIDLLRRREFDAESPDDQALSALDEAKAIMEAARVELCRPETLEEAAGRLRAEALQRRFGD